MATVGTDIPVIAEFSDRCIILRIRQETIDRRGSVYKAVRAAWIIEERRRNEAKYVLTVVDGVVAGVYQNMVWIPQAEKWAFSAVEAEDTPTASGRYLGRRIPAEYREPSASNPVRYTW